MATYTSNLNLKKPALDDDALITDINNNMDILDAAANGIEDALAIVANGNTHAAITSGRFVYVRNHNTLTEGLYVASSNIAANATLSSSNLTADSKGGLNALSEQIGTLNSKFKTIVNAHGLTAKENVTLNGVGLVGCGLLRFYHFYFTPTADINAGTELIEGFAAPYLALSGGAIGLAVEGTSREPYNIYLSNSGKLLCCSNLQNGKSYRCSICYVSSVAI